MPAETLLIGFDGFDPDLAVCWMDQGFLPNLQQIRELGCFARLTSTIPPFTYPAWSSLLTGVNPGKHGILDFVERIPNTYATRFVNSSRRKFPTIFEICSSLNMKTGSMGFPTTYPPAPVKGFMISGFDSPVAVNADASFCYPESLYHELKTKINAYTLTGFQELRIQARWHERAIVKLLHSIQQRSRIAQYLYQKDDYGVFAVVFSESDTVSHHFWSYHDQNSPRSLPNPFPADPVLKIYQALDTAAGELLALHGSSPVMIVSDHGFGPSGNFGVSINRILAQTGHFHFKKTGRFCCSLNRIIRSLVPLIPVSFQELAFRRFNAALPSEIESRSRLQNVDLSSSRVFSEELNYFPSVWLHDERFPLGRKASHSDRNSLLNDVGSALKEAVNPGTSRPFFRNIFFKDDVYFGPETEMFPDLILDVNSGPDPITPIMKASIGGPPAVEIPVMDYLGSKAKGMNGSHRPEGVFFAAGRGISSGSIQQPRIIDIAPTLLYWLNLGNSFPMDGTVLPLMCDAHDGHSSKNMNWKVEKSTGIMMTEKESADLRRKLKDLGYLE